MADAPLYPETGQRASAWQSLQAATQPQLLSCQDRETAAFRRGRAACRCQSQGLNRTLREPNRDSFHLTRCKERVIVARMRLPLPPFFVSVHSAGVAGAKSTSVDSTGVTRGQFRLIRSKRGITLQVRKIKDLRRRVGEWRPLVRACTEQSCRVTPGRLGARLQALGQAVEHGTTRNCENEQ